MMNRRRYYFVIAALFFISAAAGFASLQRSAYLGMEFTSEDGAWVISGIQTGSPAKKEWLGRTVAGIGTLRLQEHDLTAVIGEIPGRASVVRRYRVQKLLSETIRKDKPLALLLKAGDGEDERAELIPSSYPVSVLLSRTGMHYGAAFFCFAVGLIVALRKPDDGTARAFFNLMLCTSGIMVSFIIWAAQSPAIDFNTLLYFRLITNICWAYLPASFLYFCSVFPAPRPFAKSRSFVVTLFLLPALELTLYFPFTLSLPYLPFLAGFLGGPALLVHRFFTLDSPEQKAQIKWVLWGCVVFGFSVVAFLALPVLLNRPDYHNYTAPAVVSIIVPLTMAFAIAKYRLMDIDTLFDNTLAYAVTLCVLALLDMSIILGLARTGIAAADHSTPLVSLLSVWGVILAYAPVRDRARHFFKRLLRREQYDSYATTLDLARELLFSFDVRTALDKTLEIIDHSLHPKGAMACVYRNGRIEIIRQKGKQDVTGLASLCAETEGSLPVPLSGLSGMGGLPPGFAGGVHIPVIGPSGRLGCVILGDKQSERLYSREDLKLLSILISQAALSIEGIRYKDAAAQEAHRERERISSELHDGIGAEFTGIIAYAEQGVAGREPNRELFSKIAETSRRGVRELRNIMWATAPESGTFEFFTAYVKRHVEDHLVRQGLEARLTFHDAADGKSLSPAVFLAALRIMQEASHNIVKHASATLVDLEMDCNAEALTVRIADNGKGFDLVTATPSGLVNMRRRAERAGGSFRITSVPGQGTEVHAVLPLSGVGNERDL